MSTKGMKSIASLSTLLIGFVIGYLYLDDHNDDLLLRAEVNSLQNTIISHCRDLILTQQESKNPEEERAREEIEIAREIREACISAWHGAALFSPRSPGSSKQNSEVNENNISLKLRRVKEDWEVSLLEGSRKNLDELFLSLAFAEIAASSFEAWNDWLTLDEKPLVFRLEDVVDEIQGSLKGVGSIPSDKECEFMQSTDDLNVRLSELEASWRAEYGQAKRAALVDAIAVFDTILPASLEQQLEDRKYFLGAWDHAVAQLEILDYDYLRYANEDFLSLRGEMLDYFDQSSFPNQETQDSLRRQFITSLSDLDSKFAKWEEDWSQVALADVKEALGRLFGESLKIFTSCNGHSARKGAALKSSGEAFSQVKDVISSPQATEYFWEGMRQELKERFGNKPRSELEKDFGIDVFDLTLGETAGIGGRLEQRMVDFRTSFLKENLQILSHESTGLMLKHGATPALVKRYSSLVDSLWTLAIAGSGRQVETLVVSRQEDLMRAAEAPISIRFRDASVASHFVSEVSTFLRQTVNGDRLLQQYDRLRRLQAVARAISEGAEKFSKPGFLWLSRPISTRELLQWRSLVDHTYQSLASIGAMELDIENQYGINIIHEAQRNAEFALFTNSLTAELASLSSIQLALRELHFLLAKYPRFMFRASGLRNLHLVQNIREPSRTLPLGGFRVADSIFLSLGDKFLGLRTDNLLYESLGHELFHQLDRNYEDLNDQRWATLPNTTTVTLFNSTITVEDGASYARPYGRESPGEDRATIAEALLRPDRINSLLTMCRTNKNLRRKVEAITGCRFDEVSSRFQRLLTLDEYRELLSLDSEEGFGFFRKWSTDQERIVWMDHTYWNALADWRHVRFVEEEGQTLRYIDGRKSIPENSGSSTPSPPHPPPPRLSKVGSCSLSSSNVVNASNSNPGCSRR